MQITKEALHTVRLVAVFVRHGYTLTRIEGPETMDEIWLTNKKDNKYPLVRISSYGTNSDQYDLQRIIAIFKTVIGNDLKEKQVLSIHFGFDEVKQIDDRLKIICLEQDYCSDKEILSDFSELDKVIVDCPPEELNESYRKAVQYLNRISQRAMFFPSIKSIKDIPLSYIISVICFIICIFARYLSQIYDDQVTGVLLTGAYYKTLIYGNNEWWRLLTTGFVHYSFFHLFSNIISIMSLDKVLEEQYGKTKTLLCLIVSIISGSLFLLVANNNNVVIGLSGGIYGLIGLLCVYCFESGVIRKKEIRSSMIRLIVLNAIISFLPSVSLIGHLGGFVGGLLFGIIISKKDTWKSLRINSIIASIALLVILGFGIIKDTKLNPIYTGTDTYYINGLRDFRLENYANKTENNLINYYLKVEKINNEKN